MKLPSATLSVRIPQELWQRFNEFVENEVAKDLSSAVRVLIEGGLKLKEIKNEIDDPKRVQELANQWNSKINENDIFAWANNLSDQETIAVQGAIELKKELRNKI